MEPLSSGRGRWIGYVAMSTDEMTWRLGRCESVRLNPCDLHPNVKVDSWFLSLYTSAVGASRADPSSAATGGVDLATSSPPAWIPSSLRSPLVRIRHPRRREGESSDLCRLSTLRSC
uniref:Uncharacterized protein n=1 Tax=Oryza rufipogon TaxID=4529 RepID=A0A0E0QIG8_ORYRU